MVKYDPTSERKRAAILKSKGQLRELMADAKELNQLIQKNLPIAKDVLKFAKEQVLLADRSTPIKRKASGSAMSLEEEEECAGPEGASPATVIDREDAASTNSGWSLTSASGLAAQADTDNTPDLSSLRSYKLVQMAVKDLRQILTSLEQISLSPFAIRALCTRGQREVSQEKLAELVEFVTGISLYTTINMADFKDLQGLIRYCQALNLERGRRAKDLALPPLWDRDGVWLKLLVGLLICLRNRFTGALYRIDPEWDDVEIDQIWLSDNFSEERAHANAPGKTPMLVLKLEYMGISTLDADGKVNLNKVKLKEVEPHAKPEIDEGSKEAMAAPVGPPASESDEEKIATRHYDEADNAGNQCVGKKLSGKRCGDRRAGAVKKEKHESGTDAVETPTKREPPHDKQVSPDPKAKPRNLASFFRKAARVETSGSAEDAISVVKDAKDSEMEDVATPRTPTIAASGSEAPAPAPKTKKGRANGKKGKQMSEASLEPPAPKMNK